MTYRFRFAVCAAALSIAASAALAQGPNPYAASQALYSSPGGGSPADLVDAHGQRAHIPVQYCEPVAGGGYAGGDMYGAYGGGAVGYQPDQCGPHYFDVKVEYVSLARESFFENTQAFTALNFNDDGTPPNIVLSSDNLRAGEYEPGFRIIGRYDVSALTVLELGYSGFFSMSSNASFTDPGAQDNGLGNLFSPFTNFGDGFLPEGEDDPLEGGFDPADLNDFSQTDRASSQSIFIDSDLQTAELSFRRYWVGWSPRVSGTLLYGFRYTKLQEVFGYQSVGTTFPPGSTAEGPGAVDPNDPAGVATADYLIRGDNNLAGAQIGGDMWVTLRQGLRFGAEGKVGLYSNRYELATSFTTSDGQVSITEQFDNNQEAFITEAKLELVADVLPSLSLKAGYEVLFLNSLVLVGDNFNAASPYDNDAAPDRVSFLNAEGDAFYHGFNAGIEYVW